MRVKGILKQIYKTVPFKQPLFSFMKRLGTPDQKIYRHLSFDGIFDISMPPSQGFKMRHYGFEIENVFVDHIFPYQIPKYVKHEYEKEWYFRHLPPSVFRALENRFGWHLCVTAKAVEVL